MKSSRLIRTIGSSLAALAMVPALSNAALVHRYDFATDASDSVGTADGTVYGSASIANGVLTTANTAAGLDGNGNPQNGVLLDASAVAGITGAFTIEAWTTSGWSAAYSTIFSFSDGTTNNFLIGTSSRPNVGYGSGVAVVGGGSGADLVAINSYADNGPHHLVATYDGTHLTYYLDGSTDLGGFNSGGGYSATINVSGLNLSSLDVIGLSGGAPWPDPSFAGDLLDFRIFDNAMTASQVADLGALGSDATNAQIIAAVPEPAAALLGAFGLLGLLRRRR